MISVDKVYQKVLALANKEQRGYITPKEFNLYANQAQMEIFEQYFYDLNQFKRTPRNDSEYHDMVGLIEEKLYSFKATADLGNGDNVDGFYRLGDVYAPKGALNQYNNNPFGGAVCVEQIDAGDLAKTQLSPLTRATNSRPVYYVSEGRIWFYPPNSPANNNLFKVNYIMKPNLVNWTYIVIDGKALYNSGAGDANDFDLHESEESNLVIRILQLAGLTLKDYNLTQLAAQKEIGRIQQEKQ